jgi:peptidoglycan biosynthesis protein MviN/MurJ (putative lipid II flippase)
MIIGAPASTVVVSLSRAFYAAQLPRFPVLVDICGNSIELAFIPALAYRFGLGGVGFAYMLLPWMTGSGLLFLFIRRNRSFPTTEFMAFLAKVVLTAITCAWFAGKAGHLLSDGIETIFLRSLVMVLLSGILTLSGFLAGALALGVPEAASIRDVMLTFAGRLRYTRLPVTARP